MRILKLFINFGGFWSCKISINFFLDLKDKFISCNLDIFSLFSSFKFRNIESILSSSSSSSSSFSFTLSSSLSPILFLNNLTVFIFSEKGFFIDFSFFYLKIINYFKFIFLLNYLTISNNNFLFENNRKINYFFFFFM